VRKHQAQGRETFTVLPDFHLKIIINMFRMFSRQLAENNGFSDGFVAALTAVASGFKSGVFLMLYLLGSKHHQILLTQQT
jgi:hypothetical protein